MKTKTHFYKGYAIHKPEGCKVWNIHKIKENGDWDWAEGYGDTLKECRAGIDLWEKNGEEF